MKRFLLILTGVALLLSACGTADDQGQKDTAQESKEPSKETTSTSIDLADFSTDLQVEATDHKALFKIQFMNNSNEDVKLTFSSGQKYEIIVNDSNGMEVYRYSNGRAFTEALETIELKANEELAYQEEWDYSVDGTDIQPGTYTAIATILPMNVNDHEIESDIFTTEQTFEIKQIAENDNVAFRNIEVTGEKGDYTVTGEARVFEAVMLYSVEDGHNIIIEETPFQLKEGAPSWTQFEMNLTISKEDLPKNGTLTLHLYERSAKDGSIVNSYFAVLESFKSE
ncbi:BsuPI-related putative proteinase inhibitor [Bacillus salitolerans]|uniref:Intracellular proteinase inhibitor BsuPI domain-containing protein n=1 Tax=Bacillus salitolerans TaxID=1437434 RepID=A0ABW4LMK1_9BACI